MNKNVQDILKDIDWSNPVYDFKLEEDLRKSLAIDLGEKEIAIKEGIHLNTSELDTELLLELVQHLTDLDFLQESWLNKRQFRHLCYTKWDVLKQSISNYLALDPIFLESLKTDGFDLLNDLPEDLNEVNDALLTLIVNRLNFLTSIDGQFQFTSPLKKGQHNLESRILHFRLNTLALYNGHNVKVSDPISNTTWGALAYLNYYTGKLTVDQFYAIMDFPFTQIGLNDLNATNHFYKIFVHHFKFRENKTLFFSNPKYLHKKSWPFYYLDPRSKEFIIGENKKQFRRNLRLADVKYRKPILKDQDDNLEHALTEGSKPMSFFTNRLIQSILWMEGYYNGILDSDIGNLSTEALFDFIQAYTLGSTEHHHKFLIKVSPKKWALNLYFINDFIHHQLATESHTAFATADLEPQEEEDRIFIREHFYTERAVDIPSLSINQYKKDKSSIFSKFWKSIKKAGRRIYYGTKTILKSAATWLHKGLSFLKDKIIGPAINFYKYIRKQVRDYLKLFWKGLKKFFHFALRKPIITLENNHFVYTKFDVDFDCITYSSKGIAPQSVLEHQNVITKLNKQLTLFTKITSEVIHAVISVWKFPLSAIQIILRIGRIVKLIVEHRTQVKLAT